MVKHSVRKHALLSASGSSRWINCPPSARIEEKIPDKGSSTYAEEGTLAHEFADLSLRIQSHVGPLKERDVWYKEQKKLRKHKLYADDMEDHVAKYVDYVLAEWLAARQKTPDAVLDIEAKTDYSYLVPEGFGTCDGVIIADGVLEIIDFKYGKGVKVDAVNNSQLRLYGLGGLRKYQILYEITSVKMTIVQPRLDHISSETLSVFELIKWANEVAEPSAKQADKGEGNFNPGDWCRWCKAKPTCKALAEHNTNLAKHDFADPRTLSDEELLEAYRQSSLLVDWANSIGAYLLEQALEGKNWEGYKVVEGRSVRKWLNEGQAIKSLVDMGYEKTEVTNTKIKGIGDVEKMVGKGKVDHLLIKPPGKPTLVLESDKRPAMGVEQAKKDFAD